MGNCHRAAVTLAESICRAPHRLDPPRMLDHIIVFNERHLRHVLSSYFQYHHRTRIHLSLDKDCPQPRPKQPPSAGKIIAFPEVGGLHHRYERRAA
jgi:putative transposase